MSLPQAIRPSLKTAEDQVFAWMGDVASKTFLVMERFKKPNDSGAFRYSLSGDIPQNRWGLGNACFAVKIYKMLGRLDALDVKSTARFIKSFQNNKGAIFDPEIKKRSFITRFLRTLKHFDLNYFDYLPVERAETRQAYAAILNLGQTPSKLYLDIPQTAEQIQKYINRLDWKNPWGASSHFSHLIFFLRHSFGKDAEHLIEFSFQKLNSFQQPDGSWYLGKKFLPKFQKVNAAMKIMLAYETVGRQDFEKAESLIDLCLSAVNEGHACNHFNVVCVLYACARKTDYRRDEICRYFLERIEKFKEHYYPDLGGFSFLPRKANTHYYGARISLGKSEPDVHGTHLFLWALVLISDFLGFRHQLKFGFPIT